MSGVYSCVELIARANADLIGLVKDPLVISLALSVPVVVCIAKVWCLLPTMTPHCIL